MREDFGERLRSLRLAAGLSQRQLGQPHYSASYVSLLEAGRRAPTREVAARLASRLGKPVGELWVELPTDTTGWSVWLDVERRARALMSHGSYGQALDLADAGLSASQAPTGASRFAIDMLRAELFLPLERYDECTALALDLSDHPIAGNSGDLRCSLLTLASRSERSAGRFEAAVELARRAVMERHGVAVTRANLVDARIAFISALSDGGHDHEAAEQARLLAEEIEGLHDQHLVGRARWTIGNVWFNEGNIAAALAEHDTALEVLSQTDDVRTRGRFMKASASRRLKAGCVDGAQDLLTAARPILELVGNRSDLDELVVVEASLDLHSDDAAQALARLSPLRTDQDWSQALVAELEEVRTRAHLRLGEAERAREAAARASAAWESAGVMTRALDILREANGS